MKRPDDPSGQENPHDLVLILDFGAQYTQLIARRVRESHVYCEIVSYHLAAETIRGRNAKGIILSGGPASVYGEDAPMPDPGIYDLGVPILGICYGHQVMSSQLGGSVSPAETREYGRAEITVREPGALFNGIAGEGETLSCWMSHGDTVHTPPPGFLVAAETPSTPVAAMANDERRMYGVQFHPEVAHTPFGGQLITEFLIGPCGCSADWTPVNFIESAVEHIRATVGRAHVVCGVSGGIDSCCVAALMHRAIGEQLTCIFVDHGMLRKGESDQVRIDFAAGFGIHLVHVDAAERFLTKLAGVTDPETKRKVIGNEFVRVFEEAAGAIEGAAFLAQGTLYPDVIESGGVGTSATIKTHHNVGGLPDDMTLKVIEPLRLLFKDEARAVAAALGVPESIVWRHPFPGPGLGIRILGEVTAERIEVLQRADAIFIEELRAAGLYREIWQALAVLAPVRSVGVMGDQRTYGHPIILRAVTSDDAMTARWAHIPYEVLDRVSSRIVNEVDGINRVVYDITSKPPATIEWE